MVRPRDGMQAAVTGPGAARHQAISGSDSPETGHRWSRGIGGAHPSCVLLVRNMINPDGVQATRLGRPTARKAELPGGRRKIQEANAGGSKGPRKPGDRAFTCLSHNSPDTGPGGPARKGAHVDQVSL